ncbi:hypothetical protein [Parahaliea mediterranea]|uniref:Uncharacterized protein n=1 Tax=Parahaliea mediterranea TaxID=651086 RepID=A0A939DHD8_9GAMM|nr:hypothetical protein [Parahaliea mediterranea]MBN7798365.1 hypothetical protein [Parahaliea mediterranea]
MLSEQSYHIAMAAYLGAAVLALLLTAWWLRRRWHPAWIGLLVLPGAAVLLTPAYPEAGVSTLAPAVIVAGFQWLTVDQAAAEHALRPLLAAVGLALLLALLFAVALRLRRGSPPASAPAES